jgi:hypothetical protein
MSMMRSDSQLGWVPAIPLPFSYKGWRTLWRWRPQCLHCKGQPIFKSDAEWEQHYVLNHIEPPNPVERGGEGER